MAAKRAKRSRAKLAVEENATDGDMRKKLDSAVMLRELANRVNHGEMLFRDFAIMLQTAFTGAVAILDVTLVECGFDLRIHCCAKVGAEMEKEQEKLSASEKRKDTKVELKVVKKVGNA